VLRVLIGFALGWFAAEWYRTNRASLAGGLDSHGAVPRGDLESRVRAAAREGVEAAQELGEEAKAAARVAGADVAEKAERVRRAAEG